MLRVELIYDSDCPNIHHARKALLRGFNQAGIRPSWTEWDRNSRDAPAYARRYGSPTVLVNGRDVTGVQPTEDSDSCRIYGHGAGDLRGAPPVNAIASALNDGGTTPVGRAAGSAPGWWRFLASLPGVGAGLLPVGICPACWPAYAGVLSSLGLGFLLESTYLLPLTIGSLGLAFFALAFRAKARQGYGPLLLGGASVALVLTFKFAYAAAPVVYLGILTLVIASVWNAWPKNKSNNRSSCPRCVSELSRGSAS